MQIESDKDIRPGHGASYLSDMQPQVPNSRKTFAEIMEQRQQEAHEREQQATAWAAEVTEQLMNERSKFLEDFDEEQQRVFGFLPPR